MSKNMVNKILKSTKKEVITILVQVTFCKKNSNRMYFLKLFPLDIFPVPKIKKKEHLYSGT